MSTRSGIAIQYSPQLFIYVYCHWDGYPSHHIPILSEFYNTKETAEAIISLGDLSILDKSFECPEGHSFDTPVKGHSVFFGRDRGETNCEANSAFSIHSLKSKARKADMEYIYIFNLERNQWSWYKLNG